MVRWLLWPAAIIFDGLVRLWAAAYRMGILKSERLGGTVISVGNLTVGGTGKTPMVIWLAERLIAEGKQVGILTRGYRGSGNPDAQDSQASDEVALLRGRLARAAMLGVGADRYAKGQMLERHGVQWFVLDDGFQHLKLARDVDIVLLDATDAFGGGLLLPAGRLREPRTALGRASIVVITRSERAPAVEALVNRFTDAPVFYAQMELVGVYDSGDDFVAPNFSDSRENRLLAFCAIGNPSAFFDDLLRWGFKLVGEESFRDHHRFTKEDGARLNRRALEAGAEGFICTEKDLWNGARLCAGKLPVWVCRTRLRVADGDKFWQSVLQQAERHRSREAR
jgi:tetraacyldisaccharide 4'-kinase